MIDIYPVFCDTVERERLLTDSAKVLCGVSGGADSVCMCELLLKYIGPERLVVGHYNHMLRGAESERDEAFVRKYASERGLEFVCGRGDIGELSIMEGLGTEECARKYRYAFFEEARVQQGCDLIAVAHNAGDNAETILMHFMRGGALDGLRGISYRRDNIIRPMLDITRADIEDYLADRGISYVYDSTNGDNTYLRNLVRNELLPEISRVLGYDIRPVLCRQARLAAADSEFIREATDKIYEKLCRTDETDIDSAAEGIQLVLDGEKFKQLHTALRRRCVKKAIGQVRYPGGQEIFPGEKDIESAAVDRVMALFEAGKKGASADCGRGIMCTLTHSGLVFTVQSAYDSAETVPPELEITEADISTCLDAEGQLRTDLLKATERRVIFDKDKYSDIIDRYPVRLRHPEPGDRIQPFGMKGTKTLQKLLIDAAVPAEKRAKLWILAAGSEVLWVPGTVSSEKMRVDGNTVKLAELVLKRTDKNKHR